MTKTNSSSTHNAPARASIIGKRIMGIDYGAKRVGVALSDTGQSMAFPHSVVENKLALEQIQELIKLNDVPVVVLGLSQDLKAKDNPIMAEINKFADLLKAGIPTLEIVFEPEYFTTLMATQFQGENAKADASAAAILLQSYLDRLKYQENK